MISLADLCLFLPSSICCAENGRQLHLLAAPFLCIPNFDTTSIDVCCTDDCSSSIASVEWLQESDAKLQNDDKHEHNRSQATQSVRSNLSTTYSSVYVRPAFFAGTLPGICLYLPTPPCILTAECQWHHCAESTDYNFVTKPFGRTFVRLDAL
jgi:hypothetical protein